MSNETTLFGNIVDVYNDIMIRRHPRTDGYFLMSSPFPTMVICAIYIYFVKSLGPRLMRDRKPFDLKRTIILYNVIQVIISIYIVYKGLIHAWLFRYSFRCQPVDYSDHPDEIMAVKLCWMYYFCKITELLDTVFFVMRKKFDQITHLHVIHHTIMPLTTWWGVKFLPSGHGTFFGLVNTFVHIIMYTYYLMAAMGPQYQKYLWWKKHLTTIQMVQFIAVFIHTAQLLFIECEYPKVPVYLMCLVSILFFVMFSNFYIQAYIKERRLPGSTKNAKAPIKNNDHSEQNDNIKQRVKNIITEAMDKTSGVCYIGQNGLYKHSEQTSSKAIKAENKDL